MDCWKLTQVLEVQGFRDLGSREAVRSKICGPAVVSFACSDGSGGGRHKSIHDTSLPIMLP